MRYWKRAIATWLATFLVAALAGACAGPGGPVNVVSQSRPSSSAEPLPGQVRKLGSKVTYLTQRRLRRVVSP
jgi:hypothetical protein